MPSWAQDDPREYWDAADLYERANGRLYVSADFALPRELGVENQIALAREFAHALTDEEQLPYTLAVHEGRDQSGHIHNPHAHLMFSERQHDGIERSRTEWFRRANPEDPERGGAPKSRTFHGSRWVEHARERWLNRTNVLFGVQGSALRSAAVPPWTPPPHRAGFAFADGHRRPSTGEDCHSADPHVVAARTSAPLHTLSPGPP